MTQPPYGASDDASRDPGASPAGGQGEPQYGQRVPQQPAYGQQAPGGQLQGGQGGQGQQPWGQQGLPSYGGPGNGDPQAAPQGQGTGMAITALVLGILAILAAWWPIGSYGGIVLGILAVIFGIVGVRRNRGRGMAISGLVIGGVALVASIIMSIIWTQWFIELAQVASDCMSETGTSSGSAYEECVAERVVDLDPFGLG